MIFLFRYFAHGFVFKKYHTPTKYFMKLSHLNKNSEKYFISHPNLFRPGVGHT